MNRTLIGTGFFAVALLALIFPSQASAQTRVEVASGTLEGVADANTGVRSFKGIPFAAPPVGELRWREPQPVAKWEGVRKADKFGPRAMQRPVFGDMIFRSDGMSEDCLYLNVWTPAKAADEKLPVLVYFFGGGFIAGDGSEGRYDGESMAKKGIVSVTITYRLNVFGFYSHPELTKESPHHASGNYGLLDQHAALLWVRDNIAAFGGDPKRVTIAGESAGSVSVCAQMASPLSKDLIAGAIGESGAIIGPPLPGAPLAEAEAGGVKFAATLGLGEAPTLAALRAVPAEQLLAATAQNGGLRMRPVIDGYFLPKSTAEIFQSGEQAHVPLLAGTNSEESGAASVLGREQPTVENYRKALEKLFPGQADAAFNAYPASNEAEVLSAARDLASDRFISYGTWKWASIASATGGQPTFYYLYAQPRPSTGGASAGPVKKGASHSAEIEYALGNLHLNKVYAWTAEDREVSRQMQEYFANFIKTGNPNGAGLPEWPKVASGQRLVIEATPHAESTEPLKTRAQFLDQFFMKK